MKERERFIGSSGGLDSTSHHAGVEIQHYEGDETREVADARRWGLDGDLRPSCAAFCQNGAIPSRGCPRSDPVACPLSCGSPGVQIHDVSIACFIGNLGPWPGAALLAYGAWEGGSVSQGGR